MQILKSVAISLFLMSYSFVWAGSFESLSLSQKYTLVIFTTQAEEFKVCRQLEESFSRYLARLESNGYSRRSEESAEIIASFSGKREVIPVKFINIDPEYVRASLDANRVRSLKPVPGKFTHTWPEWQLYAKEGESQFRRIWGAEGFVSNQEGEPLANIIRMISAEINDYEKQK